MTWEVLTGGVECIFGELVWVGIVVAIRIATLSNDSVAVRPLPVLERVDRRPIVGILT